MNDNLFSVPDAAKGFGGDETHCCLGTFSIVAVKLELIVLLTNEGRTKWMQKNDERMCDVDCMFSRSASNQFLRLYA